ncbi:MAG: plasmid replication protein RepC [Aestuariivita sp.]|nr:plasmid replication protein RepC [Aestuariivita sp.]
MTESAQSTLPDIGILTINHTQMNELRNSSWQTSLKQSAKVSRQRKTTNVRHLSKGRATAAIKRVGAYIGLKPTTMMLMDTLLSYSQTKDWDHGRTPIVWPSNQSLIERTGLSLSAVKRHTRRLEKIGVLNFKNSPNGKRWGKRNGEGIITEAYGFDLSPLAKRIEEFEQLEDEIQAENEHRDQLRRQITVLRRLIRKSLDDAKQYSSNQTWVNLHSMFEDHLLKMPNRKECPQVLKRYLTSLQAINEKIEEAFHKLNSEQQENTSINYSDQKGRGDDHLLEVKSLKSGISTQGMLIDTTEPVVKNQKSNTLDALSDSNSIAIEIQKLEEELNKKYNTGIKLEVVLEACSEFASFAHSANGYIRHWDDLHRAVTQLSPMIGIPKKLWTFAQNKLGAPAATLALVLTFDKYCTGEVKLPSGYFLGMIKKAVIGELNLERSFYGRLNSK